MDAEQPFAYMRLLSEQEVRTMLSWGASSEPLTGVDRILIPVERCAKALAECKRYGVPLDFEKRWDMLALAEQTRFGASCNCDTP